MTKHAEGEDFDTLFRSALRSANSGDDESSGSEEGELDEGSPDDETESEETENECASEKTTEVTQDQLAGPQIAELQEEIALLKAENENLREHLAAINDVPENLRDGTITGALAAEPDTSKADEFLTAYLTGEANRVLPPQMALRDLSVKVQIAGRDHRIMIGDFLERRDGDAPPTLCKCVGIAEFMKRRRVQEWIDGKWQKVRVIFFEHEPEYRVITEARARELAPAAFPASSPAKPSEEL